MKSRITDSDIEFMRKAIEISQISIEEGGGPFGAVIVQDGIIVSTGNNRVTKNNDPTAHAEIEAIRDACKKLGKFKLSNCTIYTSCEPCPMCLGAIYWAGIKRVFYGNNREDAKVIDFDDSFIYDELNLKNEDKSIEMINILHEEAIVAFEKWSKLEDKVKY